MAGPFSRCDDDPPAVPPSRLDAGSFLDVAPPDSLPPDLEQPDQGPASDLWVETTGRACVPGSTECGQGRSCLLVLGKKVGVCTSECVFSTKTPLVPNSCLPQDKCGQAPPGSSGANGRCYRKCALATGQNKCSTGVACHFGMQVGLPGQGLCLGAPACTTDNDCPVRTAIPCKTSGGVKCPAGQFCHPMGSFTTAGYCSRAGKCDKVSGLCDDHALGKAGTKVDDLCADDTQCVGEMTCMMERDDKKTALAGGAACTSGPSCCSGKCTGGKCAAGPCLIYNRNGYCSSRGCSYAATWTGRKCPAGSSCNRLYSGGLCQSTCDLTAAAQCRGQDKDRLGDYECRAWNNLSMSGKLVAGSPVCDFGLAMPCDLLLSRNLDCSSVGLATTNKTKMSCRGLDGTKLAKYTPGGFCLDDTASGTLKR